MTPDSQVSPSDLFLSPDLTEERAWAYLAARGFRDPAAADLHLQSMAEDLGARERLAHLAADLLDALLQTPDPDAALVGFSRYVAARSSKVSLFEYLQEDLRAIDVLVRVLGTSPYLSEILIRNPEYLHWLLQQLDRSPPDKWAYGEELEALVETLETEEGRLDALRRFKRREMLRIATRDILGIDALEAATAQLADLADMLVDRSLEIAWEAAAPPDRPGTFAVIGMGKLGGRELNYSSDIDLIYIYDPADPEDADAHRIFQRLARKLTAVMSEHTSESYLFRVDLRLRPMGRSGNAAYSIQQCHQYYETWGETFERFALIKARPIAGDPELGQRFIDLVQPFVYRKYLDHAALEEMYRYKSRVDRALWQPESDRNVKVGRGGIREVELFTQVLQLTYGAAQPGLRSSNTLAALAALAEAGLVPATVSAVLADAYVFMRTAEHRLQLVQHGHTHTLSEEIEELEICARRLGFASAADLESELGRHRDRVHEIYSSLFERRKGSSDFGPRQFYRILAGELSDSDALAEISEYQFSNPELVLNVIRSLDQAPSFVHSKSANRNILANLLPLLLASVAQAAEPERVLVRVERLTIETGAASAFFRSLLENDELRSALILVLDAGELPSERLIRHPELLDSLIQPRPEVEAFGRHLTDVLASFDAMAPAESADLFRRFKSMEEFKVIVEWLAEEQLRTLQRKLSQLADASVQKAAEWQAAALRPGDEWGIVALGKLGGRELTVHSDLDLVILYEGDPDDAERFVRIQTFVREVQAFLEEPTSEGVAYRIDTRLRPEGRKGALALPVQTFARYLESRAEMWERLAWTRYRFLAGSRAIDTAVSRLVSDFVYGEWQPAIPSYMNDVRRRMERELAHESDTRADFKVGRGGLADIDFMLQLIQIREGRTRSEFRVAGTADLLADLPSSTYLTDEEAADLGRAYRFLQRFEVAARMEADANVSWIDLNPGTLKVLGRRLGMPEPEAETLLARYRTIAEQVRSIYNRVLERLQS